MKRNLLWLLLGGLLLLNPSPGLAQTEVTRSQSAGPLVFPPGFMKSVKEYGAKGDGVTDDTAALQTALNEGRSGGGDFFGRPKMLYFPAGIYLISDTLSWTGCCVTLQGQGSEHSILLLKNNASGFGNPASPKALLRTPAGNMSFRQNLWNLGFNTGRGNPGAIGLDWISNNWGSLHDVSIRSGDGQGVAGLAMTRQWPGPCLVKNLRVEGFDYGINIGTAEYGPTFERLTLRGQRVAGIRNDGNTLAIRAYESGNTVPALLSLRSWSLVALIDGAFSGGAANFSAIEAEGKVYLRNVITSGYQSALKSGGAIVPGGAQAEYFTQAQTLFDSPLRALNLPIHETPEFHDNDPATWGAFLPRWYGDTGQLQALLNSGKATLYFPAGAYLSYDERAVTVPATVKRIVGFASVVNGDGNGVNGGGIKFVVQENSPDPLIIEQFGYGVKVEHRSARAVALKYGGFEYSSIAGAGDLFLEDVGLGPLAVAGTQRVWARQLNNEYGGTKITNAGGALWVLGLKTERAGTVIETTNGGQTELLGTLIYPAGAVPANEVAFVSRDSATSLLYAHTSYCAGCAYVNEVSETRGGETRLLARNQTGGRVALFSGFSTPTNVNAPPSITLLSPANGATVSAGTTLTLHASASDTDGNPVKVEFFAEGVKAGERTLAPYCLRWTPTIAGNSALTARATDNGGAVSNSTTVNVSVTDHSALRVFLPLVARLNFGFPLSVAGPCTVP